MGDFTILKKEDIFGIRKSKIFKKYGAKCRLTDFAILLGGYQQLDDSLEFDNCDKIYNGWWWTKSIHDDDAKIVTPSGKEDWNLINSRTVGVRPVLPYSSNYIIKEAISVNEIIEVEYGEYPQDIVSKELSKILENEHFNGRVIFNKTGKEYTTDAVWNATEKAPFQEQKHIEYKFNGKKYIRILGDYNNVGQKLSNGDIVKFGNPYWIEVKPIKWFIDERKGILISKKILFAGVPFKWMGSYFGDFEETDLKKYLDNHFSKDIIPSNIEKELNTPYQLKDEAKANILSRVTGLSYDELINMDLESIEKYIEQKFGKKPTYDLRIRVDGIPIEECHAVPVELLDERMNKAISAPKRRIKKR